MQVMEEQQQSRTKTELSLETQFQLAVRERHINELLVRVPRPLTQRLISPSRTRLNISRKKHPQQGSPQPSTP